MGSPGMKEMAPSETDAVAAKKLKVSDGKANGDGAPSDEQEGAVLSLLHNTLSHQLHLTKK